MVRLIMGGNKSAAAIKQAGEWMESRIQLQAIFIHVWDNCQVITVKSAQLANISRLMLTA